MEKQLLINLVQGQIGYDFRNPDLLLQAFTRRSYASENGGEDNEILEFIGDKALDLAIVKLLISRYGQMKNGEPVDGKKAGGLRRLSLSYLEKPAGGPAGEFVCSADEGELTTIKSRMVQKKTLARRTDEMGFAPFLRMGKGDKKAGVSDEASVKEDLFEAIVGAVALDCKWDFATICSVVEAMILPDDFFLSDADDNYVRIIYELEKQNGLLPWFRLEEAPYSSSWYYPFDGISQNVPPDADMTRLNFRCELKFHDNLPLFRGFGASKNEARMNVCRVAYEYLEKKGYLRERSLRDEIENPNVNDAVGQLEILARRGYFPLPTYDFRLNYDKNGNPVWTCQCRVQGLDPVFEATSSSKKDAKKTAAFDMLRFVLNKEDLKND